MTKGTNQMLLELWQACCRIHIPRETFAVIIHPLSEKPFLNDQPELPLAWLHSISSCPTTSNQREETSPSVSSVLLKEAADFDEGVLHPSFLQAEQTKQPQLLLLPSRLFTL